MSMHVPPCKQGCDRQELSTEKQKGKNSWGVTTQIGLLVHCCVIHETLQSQGRLRERFPKKENVLIKKNSNA